MLKSAFVFTWKTITAASEAVWAIKGWASEVSKMYQYGRDSSTIALAKTAWNSSLHSQWWGPKSIMNSVTSSVVWLLTVQDVIEWKHIKQWWVIQDSNNTDQGDVQFNLLSSLKDDRNIIMKSMLELELEWELKDWKEGDCIRTSYWSVFVNKNLKERMIEEWIFTREKYDESLQILVRFKQLQELPWFISEMLIEGTKVTISLLIDILLLKFLFSIL